MIEGPRAYIIAIGRSSACILAKSSMDYCFSDMREAILLYAVATIGHIHVHVPPEIERTRAARNRVQPPLPVLAHSSYITTLGLNTLRGCMWINQVYKHIVCHFTRSYQLQCQAVHHLFCGRNVHHLVAVVVALSLHYGKFM